MAVPSPRHERGTRDVGELRATGCREFQIGEGDWPLRGFVVQCQQGVRAYVNRCPHLSYPLNYLPDDFLSYDRRHLQCKMHGALFEKDSGLCIAGPCLGRRLVALPSRLDDDAVVVDPQAIAHLLA
jgi:nitrite reductase/ring-hydroxylating ferredoxin subunit